MCALILAYMRTNTQQKNYNSTKLSNKNIKNILDKKEILLANKDLLTTINCSNLINIDGNDYKNDEDLLKLYGNIKSKEDYILKRVLDNPVGVITITNYNYNEILKEFISKLTNNRYLIDNFGNNINFNNKRVLDILDIISPIQCQ